MKISCGNCGKLWSLTGSSSEYWLQSVESNPCPGCGAYTLCCELPEAAVPVRLLLNQRRRMYGQSLSHPDEG